MSLTKEEILDAISVMSVNDIIKLVEMIEKKFGVSSASSLSNTLVEPEKIKEEKTEYNVIITSIGSSKVAVIKAVRSISNLGLKEAKDLVESAPVTFKEGLSKEEALSVKRTLEDSGASVEIN